MRPLHKNLRRAFTQIELLVVVSVIGILVSLLLPAVQAARAAARRVSCANNLKQIGLALHAYHDTYEAFPPVLVTHNTYLWDAGLHSGWWSWNVRILPYLEQRPLYDQLGHDGDAVMPFLTGESTEQVSTRLSVLLCPADPYSAQIWEADWSLGHVKAAHSNYPGVRSSTPHATDMRRNDGAFPATNCNTRLRDFIDGTSQTLFVGERPIDEVGEWGWWALGTGWDLHGFADHVLDCSGGLRRGMNPLSNHLDHFWSWHPDGAYFVFVDGSVRFLRYTTDYDMFLALGSRNGGEPVNIEW